MSKLVLVLMVLGYWLLAGSLCCIGSPDDDQPAEEDEVSLLQYHCALHSQERAVIANTQNDNFRKDKLTVVIHNFNEDMWSKCVTMTYFLSASNLIPPVVVCVTKTASVRLDIKMLDDFEFLKIRKWNLKKLTRLFGATDEEAYAYLQKLELEEGECQSRDFTGMVLIRMVDQCDKYAGPGNPIRVGNVNMVTVYFINCSFCLKDHLKVEEKDGKKVYINEEENLCCEEIEDNDGNDDKEGFQELHLQKSVRVRKVMIVAGVLVLIVVAKFYFRRWR